MKTRTPWHVSRKGHFINSLDNYAIAEMTDRPNRAEDAAAIVCAVNNYDRMVELLSEAAQQIEYLHGRFQQTGSGNAVACRIDALLHRLSTAERD